MLRLRSLLGPTLIGIAVWCAAGRITVATAASAATRLAVGAPWWIFPIATFAACLVPAWRRDARLTLPALLSTFPWCPLPLPAVLLLWTGPLAWAPILASCALAAAGVGSKIARLANRWSAIYAAGLTLVMVVATAWIAAPQSPQGDEPHYLVTTQSLLKDGDLQVENNYRQRDYAPYFSGTLAPAYDKRAQNGAIYPIHPIGLSVLVLPAFALFGYRGAELVVLLLAAATGGLIWRIGWHATGDSGASWFAWAAIVITPAFLLHSFAIFPEGSGAFVTAASTLLLVRLARSAGDVRTPVIVGSSVLLAAFPWLHARFALLAAGLAIVAVWYILRDRGRFVQSRFARMSWFLIVPIASALGWAAFFYVLYGAADPKAAHSIIEFRADRVPRGMLGLAFDQQYGLLPYTPVLAAAVVGLFRPLDSALRHLGWLLCAIALASLVTTVSYRMDEMWWAGLPSAPGRYAVVVLPTLAMFIASAWTRARRVERWAWLTLLLISASISAVLVVVDRGGLAWNFRDAQARWLEWLAPLVNLPRGWPSYFWVFPALMPFVFQVVFWIGIPTGLWFAGSWLGRRLAWTDASWRVACAWWAAFSLMGTVQAGWWMNGTNGLDPLRSQFAVLAGALESGRPVFAIEPLSIARQTNVGHAMVLRPEEAGKYERFPPVSPSVWLGSTELWLLDDHAFVEKTGFWVHGGERASLALRGEPEQRVIQLLVRNGSAPNLVTIDSGSSRQRFALTESQQRTVDLPLTEPGNFIGVRIGSSAGFRPSDISSSDDHRYLGVWVELQTQ